MLVKWLHLPSVCRVKIKNSEWHHRVHRGLLPVTSRFLTPHIRDYNPSYRFRRSFNKGPITAVITSSKSCRFFQNKTDQIQIIVTIHQLLWPSPKLHASTSAGGCTAWLTNGFTASVLCLFLAKTEQTSTDSSVVGKVVKKTLFLGLVMFNYVRPLKNVEILCSVNLSPVPSHDFSSSDWIAKHVRTTLR